MNFDFSIETSIDKIQNTNTKDYFKEVYQTFVNGNLRSSTVMLYSVLICDLVYKLRDLRDIYGDTKAKKILDEIEAMQINRPHSPDWESKLIELIKDRTTLIEKSDIVAIESLQKYRNLSAHPVLNNSDLLYSPNSDTVKFLIRNVLEGILTNPPFFSNRIFDTMLADLAQIKDKVTNNDDLNKYVKSRYIGKLKETDFRKLFRSLWKVVFITDDLNSNVNVKINYKVLKIFILHNKSICIDLISKERHYYSNVKKDESISKIIKLIAFFPEFNNQFEDSLNLQITNKITQEDQYRFIAWFTKPSIKEHIISLKDQEFSQIQKPYFKLTKFLCEANDCINELIDFAIVYFGSSNNFDTTLDRYDNIITQIAEELTLEQTKLLLEVSDNNDQVYKRYNMKSYLKSIAKKYEDQIEKPLYINIF